MTSELLPEIVVFAGPNGSGKSTVTRFAKIIPPYINADDIKTSTNTTDIEAAELAEKLREDALENNIGFTFETVLSTDRNLKLLERAKLNNYFIRIIYVLTQDPMINVARVRTRTLNGGHDVPREKILSRYEKALKLIPKLVEVADIMHIYDNTNTPFRIFKKRKTEMFYWETNYWTKSKISSLVGIDFK
ncbi:MAG: zeta toxin family protein [Selenomonadaceae bacterium]|nr:zeta toxin family protein [Selenomonadaceae bacterium]